LTGIVVMMIIIMIITIITMIIIVIITINYFLNTSLLYSLKATQSNCCHSVRSKILLRILIPCVADVNESVLLTVTDCS
jgi:hypothetical protein